MDANNTPATKAVIAELKAEFRQDLAALEERLKAHAEHIETKLLTAFHGWSRSAETKFRAIPNLEERLSIIEERVGRLERGGV